MNKIKGYPHSVLINLYYLLLYSGNCGKAI